jgi:predicted HTH domain antitoxin
MLHNGTCMQVQIDLPEDIASALRAGGQDIGRAAAESLALEGYRTGRLSEEQMRRLLGFESRLQVHAFLKDHQVNLNYSEDDLEHDLETARNFGSQWSSHL